MLLEAVLDHPFLLRRDDEADVQFLADHVGLRLVRAEHVGPMGEQRRFAAERQRNGDRFQHHVGRIGLAALARQSLAGKIGLRHRERALLDEIGLRGEQVPFGNAEARDQHGFQRRLATAGEILSAERADGGIDLRQPVGQKILEIGAGKKLPAGQIHP